LKEAEEVQSVKTVEFHDFKPEGKRGTEKNRGKRKPTKLMGTEPYKKVTQEEGPETSEEINEYA
jgi:hypothetical protein